MRVNMLYYTLQLAYFSRASEKTAFRFDRIKEFCMKAQGFSAGVEPGGLYSQADIQLLLCYVLSSVGEPMPRTLLLDVVAGNGMANFFETTGALEGLLAAGSVAQDGEELLTVTEAGRTAAGTLRAQLPLTLRERAVKLALQAMARRRSERETQVTVEELAHGCAVTCTVPDGDAPLFSLTLKVGDKLQADWIRSGFLDDPSLLYRSVLSILTGRAEVGEEDGETVIHVL